MLSPILEDVDERTTDLARCLERARMISVVPYLPTPPERAIDRLGDPDGEALNTAPESARLRLDEEVDVVALDAEVEQPKGFG